MQWACSSRLFVVTFFPTDTACEYMSTNTSASFHPPSLAQMHHQHACGQDFGQVLVAEGDVIPFIAWNQPPFDNSAK
ncbi:hypothetical protein B0T09DRAFT_333789 [Sordaria sp. MPI-SDFR-AT-0083]|nr:hypothetical protein B0T09DRAFT_333789 [Sordaria sp. MPI-SDFR-AT-0083]